MNVIKKASSLNVVTIAAIAAVVISATGSVETAQERIHQDQWKDTPNGGDSLNPGSDSLNPDGDSLRPDPFLKGPDPDFCISCTWPEGSPTFHGEGGG
jgi:hypothetical protein